MKNNMHLILITFIFIYYTGLKSFFNQAESTSFAPYQDTQYHPREVLFSNILRDPDNNMLKPENLKANIWNDEREVIQEDSDSRLRHKLTQIYDLVMNTHINGL
jgi:hypothetical protein